MPTISGHAGFAGVAVQSGGLLVRVQPGELEKSPQTGSFPLSRFSPRAGTVAQSGPPAAAVLLWASVRECRQSGNIDWPEQVCRGGVRM
jgi:hypothetical protein